MLDIDPSAFPIMDSFWQLPCQCAVCHQLMYPGLGPYAGRVACHSCGVLYAPELVALLQGWDRATARRLARAAQRLAHLTPCA